MRFAMLRSMIFSLLLCVLPLVVLIVCCVLCIKLSVRHAAIAVAAGVLPVVPIMALQLIVFPAFRSLDFQLGTRLLSALILNGLIEESIKFLSLLLFFHKKTTRVQCIACGAIAGLTVGCLEAVMYFAGGFEYILLRLVTAAVIHTLCAMLSALCIASFKAGKKKIMPFVYAVLVHGVYNFFAGFTGGFRWFSIAAILFAAVECRIWYTRADRGQGLEV